MRLSICLPQTNILSIAQAIVDLGLRDIGYRYVNLDDCWCVGRTKVDNIPIADLQTFPSGIPALAEKIHAVNLSIGIYTDRGAATCKGRPGSQGYESIDAATYGEWKIDYVKESSCYGTNDTIVAEYGLMRDGLNKTGRPIYFSIYGQGEWYAPVGSSLGNSWRISEDGSNWSSVRDEIDTVAEYDLTQYSGDGMGFNELMPILGPESMESDNQTRTQFSFNAILPAPIILSTSLTDINDYNLATFTNDEVIAVHQDPLLQPGTLIWSSAERYLADGAQQIWARPLVDGSYAVLFINGGKERAIRHIFQHYPHHRSNFILTHHSHPSILIVSLCFSLRVCQIRLLAILLVILIVLIR